MQTIPQSTETRNPRAKNVHRARQTERPGWRPGKLPPHKLAMLIAESIQEAAARGEHRTPEQYTPNPETQALVLQLLAVDAAADAKPQA